MQTARARTRAAVLATATELPQAPWVLEPGETPKDRLPPHLAFADEVSIEQYTALTAALPPTYPFARERSTPGNKYPRFRIAWFVVVAPRGTQREPGLAQAGNIWVELGAGRSDARVWVCVRAGAWTLWDGADVRHPCVPGMVLYFAGREFRWDDRTRVAEQRMRAWRLGWTKLSAPVLEVLWGSDWRAREESGEERPMPTLGQALRIWELNKGFSRLGRTSKGSRPVKYSPRKIAALLASSGYCRPATKVATTSDRADMDDLDCKEIEALLVDGSMDDDAMVVQMDIEETGCPLSADSATSSHIDNPTIERSLQDSVSRFLHSVRASQTMENMRRGHEDDPIDVDIDPEYETSRRWLEVLAPVFRVYSASASQDQTSALEPAAMTKMEE